MTYLGGLIQPGLVGTLPSRAVHFLPDIPRLQDNKNIARPLRGQSQHLYSFTSDTFYWSKQVTRPGRFKGKGYGIYFLVGQAVCTYRYEKHYEWPSQETVHPLVTNIYIPLV